MSERYPSGRVVTNSYDANGRLAGVADGSRTYLSNLQFQGLGGSLSSMSYGNGTAQTFGLNDRMQMISQELKRGTETLQKYAYGYGQLNASGTLDTTKNNGQLSQIESWIGTAKQWTQKFSYDDVGRLRQSAEYKGTDGSLTYRQVFDFDRFGNMYRKAANNPSTGQANPLPYTQIEESDISKATNRFATQTTYDEAGNVVSDAKFRGMGFGYDANGRMVKATKANVPDALSVYDAAGMRVAERVNDVWRFSVYDIGGKIVAEYGGVPATDEGGVKYLLSDWQGSNRAVLSNTGNVRARVDYTAYGENIGAGTGLRTATQGFDNSSTLRQKYGLTERDEATGLDHTPWRKNENRAGRWTSPDPYLGSMLLGDPQTFNRYSYVANQPTNFIDPTGLVIRVYKCDETPVIFLRGGGESRNCRWVYIDIGNGPTTTGGNEGGEETGGGGGQAQPKAKPCEVSPLSEITDPLAKEFEAKNGNVVDTQNMTDGTLDALDCMESWVSQKGGTSIRQSGYRPEAYQEHFRELWRKRNLLAGNRNPNCRALKQQIEDEIKKHQISGAPAVGMSNHTRGTAFDLKMQGISNSQILLGAQKCSLRRLKGEGEGHHFDFIGKEPRRLFVW